MYLIIYFESLWKKKSEIISDENPDMIVESCMRVVSRKHVWIPVKMHWFLPEYDYVITVYVTIVKIPVLLLGKWLHLWWSTDVKSQCLS